MKRIYQTFFTILIFLFIAAPLQARHPFRLPNPDAPIVSVRWDSPNAGTYSVQTPYVRLHPLFTFKTDDFQEYALPNTISPMNDPEKIVHHDTLSALIEHALYELRLLKKKAKRKKELTHFKIIQHKNFNFKKSCGLIVLKFKKYPFILKLFMERPSTFLAFRSTGIEPTFFFYMGGGANRHLSGFTRIKNRTAIKKKIKQQRQWNGWITFPRKWFWMPRKQKNMVLSAQNLAGHESIKTVIPGVYAVMADEIDLEKNIVDLPHKKKSGMIMQLCNDLDMFIDPHEKNYVFTTDPKTGKMNIIIVDTEHFPTMVGILKEKSFKNHSRWYAYLAGKCLLDMYFQTKKDLFNAQGKISALALM
jgi:hypothetical protein